MVVGCGRGVVRLVGCECTDGVGEVEVEEVKVGDNIDSEHGCLLIGRGWWSWIGTRRLRWAAV